MTRQRFDGSEDGSAMKRLACLAIALLCLTFAPAPGRDTYPRSSAVDALDYRIQIELKETGNEIAGDTAILFAVNEENVKNITLDLPISRLMR
jgi:hypothetical protein